MPSRTDTTPWAGAARAACRHYWRREFDG